MAEALVRVDETLTRKMAELARLELSSDEVRTFTAQLATILSYVDQLQVVDVSAVTPLLHPVELQTSLRPDAVRPSPRDSHGRPITLQSAPESVDGGFKVPPIL